LPGEVSAVESVNQISDKHMALPENQLAPCNKWRTMGATYDAATGTFVPLPPHLPGDVTYGHTVLQNYFFKLNKDNVGVLTDAIFLDYMNKINAHDYKAVPYKFVEWLTYSEKAIIITMFRDDQSFSFENNCQIEMFNQIINDSNSFQINEDFHSRYLRFMFNVDANKYQ